MFLIDCEGYYGWVDYDRLQDLCTHFDTQCQLFEDTEGEEGIDQDNYQADSPYAEYISGHNTDTFADTLCELIENTWEEYTEECEEEGNTPSWDYFWDNILWESADYQLCHTWLRVTNIHNSNNQDIKDFAKESDFCTMQDRLGL